MADIDLERKDNVGWWWWLLGLIIIAFIIYLLAGTFDRGDEVAIDQTITTPPATEEVAPMEPTAPSAAPTISASAATDRFIDECASPNAAAMDLDHGQTSTCIQDLVAAVGAVAPADQLETFGLDDEMEDARAAADRLTASPQDIGRHAEMTREAFTSISGVIQQLQEQRFPELAEPASQLSQAADSIQTDVPLLEQRTRIEHFFAQAGDVLRQIQDGTALQGTV